MAEWRGFTTESKIYCGYYTKTPKEKFKWWLEYFFSAGPKYFYLTYIREFYLYCRCRYVWFVKNK